MRVLVQVSLADAAAQESARVEFTVTLSRRVASSLMLQWTADRSGNATPGEDYESEAT